MTIKPKETLVRTIETTTNTLIEIHEAGAQNPPMRHILLTVEEAMDVSQQLYEILKEVAHAGETRRRETEDPSRGE